MDLITNLFKGLARQTGLPDPTTPYVPHSRTSREAAETIRPKVNSLQSTILTYLVRQGREGATDTEMQEALELSGNTQRPRRRELEIMGEVIDSKTTRKNANGRSATVWLAKEYADV